MAAERPHGLGQLDVIGQHGAAVSIRSKVFARVEAGRCEADAVSDWPAVARRALGLGCVLGDEHVTPPHGITNELERCELSEQVYTDDRSGATAQPFLDRLWLEEQVHGVAVDQHHRAARSLHGFCRGDEGVGRQDHFIAPLQASRSQPQLDGIGLRGLDRLTEDLFDPNRNVDVAFRPTLLETEDGSTLAGLIKQESETTVTLVDNQGKEIVVDVETIVGRQPSTLSLMPDSLAADIPETDMLNLLAYLLSQKSRPE